MSPEPTVQGRGVGRRIRRANDGQRRNQEWHDTPVFGVSVLIVAARGGKTSENRPWRMDFGP